VVTFGYTTGWRIRSEVLPLQWRQVDFKAGTVRLEPGTTKNREGRTFAMTPDLRACLEAQKAATSSTARGSLLEPLGRHGRRPVGRPTYLGVSLTISAVPPSGTLSGLECRARSQWRW
jgi:integrase